MKNFLCICLVFSFFTSLQAKETSKSIYRKHLPKDTYFFCKKHDLINDEQTENSIELKSIEGSNKLNISIVTDKDRGQFVDVGLYFAKPDEGISGLQMGYKNGHLLGGAIFDEKGLDYVLTGSPRFSDEEMNDKVSNALEKSFSILERYGVISPSSFSDEIETEVQSLILEKLSAILDPKEISQ